MGNAKEDTARSGASEALAYSSAWDDHYQDSQLGRLRAQAIEDAINTSSQLLQLPDDSYINLTEEGASQSPIRNPHTQRKWEDTADGILNAFKETLQAPTDAEFKQLWERLCIEFSSQEGKGYIIIFSLPYIYGG